ncbi:MAG: YmfQ family protein [Alphaproteobacteria bacterium]|nr:YmfQ family protein [Alphaproteobacteria bacterium]
MTQILSYHNIFQQLLPTGLIWQRHDPLLEAYASALGDELDLLYTKFETLKLNLNPQTCSSLLDEWERDTALPDDCLTYSIHESKRREHIMMRMYERTRLNLAGLNRLLRTVDSEAKVTEDETKPATLRITYSNIKIVHATAGQARAGNRLLATVSNLSLLCHLKRQLSADIKLTFQATAKNQHQTEKE